MFLRSEGYFNIPTAVSAPDQWQSDMDALIITLEILVVSNIKLETVSKVLLEI